MEADAESGMTGVRLIGIRFRAPRQQDAAGLRRAGSDG
jgi:hypothetical protein